MLEKYLHRYAVVVVIACLASTNTTFAEERTFEEKVPKRIFDQDHEFLTLTVENDLFGSGTDRHYTSGVRATYLDTDADIPAFAKFLDKTIPTFEVNESTSVFYSVGQNLYTPENITASTPDPTDRPYAGFLYGSAGFASINDNHIDDVELTVGIVGPWALGEETQTFIHDVINADNPEGWDHQLSNEPGIILSWQRRWPEAYSAATEDYYFRASPHAGVSLGNIYTYAATGLTLQLMPKEYRWQSQPLRVRPALPGGGFFAVPEDNFAWSLFAGVESRAIGRNIFLDGNTFEDSPSVDKKHFVTDANAGIAVTYGKTQVSYTLNYRTK